MAKLLLLALLLVCLSHIARAAETAVAGENCAGLNSGKSYFCGDVELALGLRKGIFEGETLRFLSYTTTKRFPAVSYSARDLLNCTGLTVVVEDSEDLDYDTELDLGYGVEGEGLGFYDAYITKSSWVALYADAGKAEVLNSKIIANPGVQWASVLPSAKSLATVQLNGTSKVVMMPLDGDYWTVIVRRDLLTLHGKTAPNTIEEMVELAEYFHGKDLNEDGEPDYGFCGKLLGPQPWVASMFYFLVAPLVQSEPDKGVYFDPETMEPLVNNEGWKEAAKHLKRLYNAGYFDSKGPNTDFSAGRCAFLVALPGIAKKTILPGVRRKDTNGTVIWDAGEGAAERITTPGSRFVLHNGSLVECDGTRALCPYEEKVGSHYINRAPFFVTGGWGAFIRASAQERAKELAFIFLSHMSLSADVICPALSDTCKTSGGVMDAFRSSQFVADEYVSAGWTLDEFNQFDVVHSNAMGRGDDEPNQALDLALPGYRTYLYDVLETQLQLFLIANITLEALVRNVDTGWRQTTLAYGLESQQRIYRRTLKLQDKVTCEDGFSYSEGSKTCVATRRVVPSSCPPGFFVSPTALACVPCVADSYDSTHGSATSCTPCPQHSTTQTLKGSTSVSNCSCTLGFVGTLQISGDTCFACPLEVLQRDGCPGGETMTVPDGMYKGPDKVDVYDCIFGPQCISSTVTISEASQCKEGSQGPVCGGCNITHVIDAQGECKDCELEDRSLGMLKLAFFLLALGLCTLMNSYATFKQSSQVADGVGGVYAWRWAAERPANLNPANVTPPPKPDAANGQSQRQSGDAAAPGGVVEEVAATPSTKSIAACDSPPTTKQAKTTVSSRRGSVGRNSFFTKQAIGESTLIQRWELSRICKEFQESKDSSMFSPVLRSMMNYFQLNVLLAFSSFEAVKSSSMGRFFTGLSEVLDFFSFSWAMDLFQTADCKVGQDYVKRTVMCMVVFLLVIASIVVLSGLWKLFVPRRGVNEVINASLFAFVGLYGSVLNGVLANLESIDVNGELYSYRDTNIDYYDRGYAALRVGSIVYAVIVFCLLPFVIIFVLYGSSQNGSRPLSTQVRGRLLYGFVAKGYRTGTYWWQFVVLMIRFAAVLIAVNTNNVLVRSVGILTLILVSHGMQVTIAPYNKGFLNLLEFVNLSCLTIGAFACCVVAGADDNQMLIDYAVAWYTIAQIVYLLSALLFFVKSLLIIHKELASATGMGAQTLTVLVTRSFGVA